jgi:hypothetical protein
MAKRENYNDLYLFMLVVREGSFTAAAQRLGLAQSGVSRAVRELEERLGYSFWCVPPVNSRSPRPASSSIEPLNPALMR